MGNRAGVSSKRRGGAVPAWLDRIGLAEPTIVSTHTVFVPSLAS